MHKRDFVIGGVIVAQLLVFGAIYALRPSAPPAVEPPVKLAVAAEVATGANPEFWGDAKSPFTLVEFGDYQCPPCAAAHPRIMQLLAKHRGRLKFVFRHLPLEKMHPQAMDAAITAEAARRQGRFRLMHDALYGLEGFVNPIKTKALADTLKLDRVRLKSDHAAAQSAVRRDQKDAAQMKVQGTPTFILCAPDGRVLRLGTLAQVEQLVSEK